MQVPLEVSFHNLDASEVVEGKIRDRVAKLERLHEGIISCRVTVESPHRQHRSGNEFQIRIDLSVPGHEIVVNRGPHHAEDPTLNQVVNDAFDAAERQLKSQKQRQRGDVKTHDAPLTGTVTDLRPAQDYGFLDSVEGRQLYFHRNAVLNADFDRLEVGEKVQYVQTVGVTGPQASSVRRVASGSSE